MTWEQEKAYVERRAAELKAEMKEAIETGDLDRFKKVFERSGRYVKKRERDALLREWVAVNSKSKKV